MMKKFITLILLLIFCVTKIDAQLSKAKEFYKDEDYASALPLFMKEYKKNKKNGSVNYWIGVCLYKLGNEDESIKYFEYAMSRRVIDAPYYLGKIYSKRYEFDNALKMYGEYQSIMIDNKKEISDEIKYEIQYARNAKSMLDHVEDIVVLDSISVDKDEFFHNYKISPETGYILSQSELPPSLEQSIIGFRDQSDSRIILASPDDNGKIRLCESVKLIDGSWDTPKFIDTKISNNGDLNFPFLMQDGMTMYYASNNESTLGGYDIFFTRKDEETGEFLKGQNLGMPYNSAANDYMLVLDDVTGLGWWATERNNIEGKVTIYVFKRNEIRKNHRIDEVNLPKFARMSDYKLTWGDEDYQYMVDNIQNIKIDVNKRKYESDFMFVIKKGLIYDSLIDFKSKDAVREMKQLCILYQERDELKSTIKSLRSDYIKNAENQSIKEDIIVKEKELKKLLEVIFKTENWVRAEEQKLLNK
ncbi:MAG: hypothetical protein E7080_02285 [Bacteroidales bacterium]|nr:hypothetical protein [Bacteroidales bacterium]